MIKKAYYIESHTLNPHQNLALEQHLLKIHQPGSILFYLWQNEHTVVIGYNQNAYKECHLHTMKEENCYLARRKSGGGAVYQDDGNLNFTFIVDEEEYDITKQTQVILHALKQFGIVACQTGRNDIEVNGYKISGNAFSNVKNKKLQHGTILVNVDFNKMQSYLNLSTKKLQSKGVESVKSRVINLSTLCPTLTISTLKKQLVQSFTEVYDIHLEPMEINEEDYLIEIDYFKNHDFIYNKIREHSFQVHTKLAWCELEAYVTLSNNTIIDMQVFSDALDVDTISKLELYFKNTELKESSFCKKEALLQNIYKEDMYTLFKLIQEEAKHV